MTDLVFLGITKTQWELINSFSSWLSAIGTIAAVVVSLWLATRASRLRCNAHAGHRLIIEHGMQGNFPEVIIFRIINTGDKPFRVNSIGWTTGVFRWKREAMQMHDRVQSSPLPVELQHGQEAQWVVPLLSDEQGWMKSFPAKMLRPHPMYRCATLRAIFVTSVGKTFTARPEAGLLKKIREAAVRQ